MLIVWDTVRASHLSIYGYQRDTTPNLAAWTRKGVRFDRALSCCRPLDVSSRRIVRFFTGQWPFRINSQWKYALESSHATLAEYLSSRGYQTAGFVANTECCNYETELDRGFAHYEDYVLTPRSLVSRTVAGKWVLENLLTVGDFYEKKWIGLQSRGARARINSAFIDWLGQRRTDRPFFAFLNYFDAHAPYIPPPGHMGHFGIRPANSADFKVLVDFVGMNKNLITKRNFLLARDCYHDCIAYLDEQLGRLLHELQNEGLLENTDVIITSDHGEEFGEHSFFGHAYNTNLDAIGVPLVIVSPRAPTGRVVYDPVSLRDLPATVVDLLDIADGSPFPGRSLTGSIGSSAPRPSLREPQPGSHRASRSGRISNQAALRSRAPGVSDVPGRFRLSLYQAWHGPRAALRSNRRSTRADQFDGFLERRATGEIFPKATS